MTGTYKLAVAACAWMLATGASARFKYDNDAEVAAARLGVERAARIYFAHYQSLIHHKISYLQLMPFGCLVLLLRNA